MKTTKQFADILRGKARRSAALKAMWQDEGVRERHSESLKQWYQENGVSEERIEKIRQSNVEFRKENPRTEEEKYACGNNMRGKKLEEILGKERATEGRKKRSESQKGVPQPAGTGAKIAAIRKANGSYINSGMTGKTHKESTKEIQGQKAKIRQELKRKLGLGRDGKVPKELLEEEYKNRGL